MMEALISCETSVTRATRRYIPEDGILSVTTVGYIKRIFVSEGMESKSETRKEKKIKVGRKGK
jgi:hypothetical protein